MKSWLQNADKTWLKWWDNPDCAGSIFVDELRQKHPAFTMRLASFLAGDITLDNGEQHSFLSSIANQVTMGKYPTQAQRRGFVKVYDQFRKRKRLGFVLKEETEEDRERRARASAKMVELATKHRLLFTKRTHKMFDDMTEYFQKKGTLSPGQLEYLRKVITQLPDKYLQDEQ